MRRPFRGVDDSGWHSEGVPRMFHVASLRRYSATARRTVPLSNDAVELCPDPSDHFEGCDGRETHQEQRGGVASLHSGRQGDKQTRKVSL